MTGGSVIFWGILIFIGLVFDQRNSKKKEGAKSNRLQMNKQLFLLAD
ncbi:flagellar motor protein [Bacillus pacificus]|nr:flagellar motor protein [Bacillus pacificus]